MTKRNSTSTNERSLKQRVEALEAEVAPIKGEVRNANGVPANAWRLAVEKYTGDEDLQSVFREALKLREADRKRAPASEEMILLDTDHMAILTEGRHALRDRLLARLELSDDVKAVSIVTVEEHLRGWLALIYRTRQPHGQIVPYLRLAKFIDFLRSWNIVDWNEPAADAYARLQSARIRIGTQDQGIALIALANDALLLSANLRDSVKVPGLRVEDWLYG